MPVGVPCGKVCLDHNEKQPLDMKRAGEVKKKTACNTFKGNGPYKSRSQTAALWTCSDRKCMPIVSCWLQFNEGFSSNQQHAIETLSCFPNGSRVLSYLCQ